ncbi:hypothetical protein J3458_008845 [Metarhizium acridum]|uniref:uncharacterized protein n=1 Tax=Metarhizium acridum TaxID=92637 RepID=UPI001C6AFC1F|nr:hypothetical protein J3458_008845 [Metarhizium acridum]
MLFSNMHHGLLVLLALGVESPSPPRQTNCLVRPRLVLRKNAPSLGKLDDCKDGAHLSSCVFSLAIGAASCLIHRFPRTCTAVKWSKGESQPRDSGRNLAEFMFIIDLFMFLPCAL